jgi:hypothetical protein
MYIALTSLPTWISLTPVWYMHTLAFSGNVHFVPKITLMYCDVRSSMHSQLHMVLISEHTEHYTRCQHYPVKKYYFVNMHIEHTCYETLI